MRCLAPREYGRRCSGDIDLSSRESVCTLCGATWAQAESFLKDKREAVVSDAAAEPLAEVDWPKLAARRAICLLDAKVPVRLMFVPIDGVKMHTSGKTGTSSSRSQFKVQTVSGKFLSVTPDRVMAIQPRHEQALSDLVSAPRWARPSDPAKRNVPPDEASAHPCGRLSSSAGSHPAGQEQEP